MKRHYLVVLTFLFMSLIASAQDKIRIGGSDTLILLGQRFDRQYSIHHSERFAIVGGGVATAKRFNLTLSAAIRNALNNVNPATPVGSLSSPFFGKSIALSTFGPLPGAGPNAGAGNRHIELQLRLTF